MPDLRHLKNYGVQVCYGAIVGLHDHFRGTYFGDSPGVNCDKQILELRSFDLLELSTLVGQN